MSGELLTLIATMAIITIDRLDSRIAFVTGRTLNGNGDSYFCFKRRATAVPYSVDRIWHGSGPTFEIIQFSNLNLVRHGH